jgi:hypothetical protein
MSTDGTQIKYVRSPDPPLLHGLFFRDVERRKRATVDERVPLMQIVVAF